MAAHVRLRQITWVLAAVVATLLVGTIGFHETLHESWFQSFYRGVITVTLTGLDSVPSNNGSRILSLVLVAAGLTIIGYAGAVIVEAITGGVVTGVLAERRRERTIEQLRDHFIICGYGRVGRRVAEEFRAAGVPFVVLDFHANAVGAAKEDGVLLIEGDATKDENLRRAGLERARGLVAASDSDADNLYVVLSARSARPDLTIVARASGEDAERKLVLAGADRIVLPYTTAGQVSFDTTPEPDTPLDVGDVLGVGSPDEIRALEDLFGPREAVAR
jgi:voltage-gated potassium channel